MQSAYVSLAGEFLTFLGGIALAWDAVWGDVLFLKNAQQKETFESAELKGVLKDEGGVIVESDRDIEYASVRRSTRHARVGAVVLAFGFFLILAGRILEIISLDCSKPCG